MPGYLSTSSASASMPVYSTSAQRNSSVSYPYIGQMTYISSTGKIEFWNGSSWVISNQDPISQDPVSIYASAAARDAALPSPTEGKLVYLSDINVIQVYNGTTWDNLGSSGSDINPLSVAGM